MTTAAAAEKRLAASAGLANKVEKLREVSMFFLTRVFGLTVLV